MIAQSLEKIGNRKYEISISNIAFVKVDEGNVRYIFHYDKVMEMADHPDNHLQFEFDKTIDTPRFDTYRYVELEEILSMIVRDRLIV